LPLQREKIKSIAVIGKPGAKLQVGALGSPRVNPAHTTELIGYGEAAESTAPVWMLETRNARLASGKRDAQTTEIDYAAQACEHGFEFVRGEVLVENDKLRGKPGSGEFLARKAGQAAEPLGRATLEFDPKRNFGAKLR